jgi:hypothetical protein
MNTKQVLICCIFVFFISACAATNYRRVLEENVASVNVTPQNTDIKKEAATQAPVNNDKLVMRNIIIWTPILLVVIAIAAVYFTAGMEIPKNTLLYATYVTNKSEKIN